MQIDMRRVFGVHPNQLATKVRLDRAMALLDRFRRALGDCPSGDWLGQYRLWLDEHNIEAQGEDGWPTENVYAEQNVREFILQRLTRRE